MLRFTAGVFKTNATKGDLSHGGEGGEPALSFGTGKFPEALIQTNFNSKILFSPSTLFLRSVARSRVAKHVYENHIEQKNIYFKQNTLKLIYPVRYS